MQLLESMIKIHKGKIEEFVEQYNIDAVVNCANPSLMGSKSNVDNAIHKAVNQSKGNVKNLKDIIIEKFEDECHTKKENIIRCRRGEVVITDGGTFCKHVIHAVGPKSDRNKGKNYGYSSSCVQKLASCYKEIMKIIFEYQDIETVAIPIISSGNYGFDFEYAFRIGLVSVYNELLDKKNEYRELFDQINLKQIYFVILDEANNYDKACKIYDEYREVFQKEHRAVYNSFIDSQRAFWNEINLYDEQKGYFAIAKLFRKLLIILRYIFGFWTWLKDIFGKKDWVLRKKTIEWVAFIKMFIPIISIMFINMFSMNNGLYVVTIVILYNLLDTTTYLIALMFLADIQRPSANIIRSLLMLIVNYIEVELDIMTLYYLVGKIFYSKTYAYGQLIDFIMGDNGNMSGINNLINFANKGIQFFFLTVVLSYFSNHMRARKFRDN